MWGVSTCSFVCPRVRRAARASGPRCILVPVTASTRGQGLRVAASLHFREPRAEYAWPVRARSSTGVNEAFSAPGCTQGLQAAALIRLLSPRQWLPGAGWGVGALGLGSRAPRRPLRQQDSGHHDPVPSGSLGPAQPQSDIRGRPACLQAPSPPPPLSLRDHHTVLRL